MWAPHHLFQDALFFFSLKIVLYDFDCMIGLIVLLQNECGTSQMSFMMNKYLLVFLSIEEAIFF